MPAALTLCWIAVPFPSFSSPFIVVTVAMAVVIATAATVVVVVVVVVLNRGLLLC